MRKQWPWLILIALPPVVVLALIWVYGVNVPATDQWGLPYLYKAVAEGQQWLPSLWAPNNEHRIVFPRLVFVSLAFATDWNVKWEMVVSWVIATIGFLAISGLAWRTRRELGGRTLVISLVASSGIYFSLMQQENWLWGFQLAFFLVQGPFLAAVYVLQRSDWKGPVRIGLAAVLCVVATFSMVQGLFTWVAMLASVWAIGERKRDRWLAVGSWSLMAAVVMGSYFIGFVRPEVGDDPNYALNHPVMAAFATFALLGGQFGRTFWSVPVLPAAVFGFVIVGAFGVGLGFAIWRRIAYRRVAPWLAIGIFGGMFCLAVAYGRAESGVDHLVTVSRYMTGPPLLVIAGMQLWRVIVGEAGRAARWGYAMICFLVAGMVVINSGWGWGEAAKRASKLRLAERVLPLVGSFSEEVDGYRQNPFASIVPSFGPPHNGAAFIRNTMPLVVEVGFRKAKSELVFEASGSGEAGAMNAVEAVGDLKNRDGWLKVGPNKRLVLSGAGRDADVILLTRDDERTFRAAAVPEDSQWEMEVPATFFGPGDWLVHSWAFDPSNGKLRELVGSPRRLVVRDQVNPKKRLERMEARARKNSEGTSKGSKETEEIE